MTQSPSHSRLKQCKAKSKAGRPWRTKAGRAQAEELGRLNLIGRMVATSLSPDEVGAAVLDSLVSIVGVDWAVLMLHENEELRQAGERARKPHDGQARPNFKQCEKCFGHAITHKKGVDSIHLHRGGVRGHAAECYKLGIRSCATLPLVCADRLVGVLMLASAQASFFDKRTEFLEALAGEVALGLQNALLHREMSQHVVALERQVIERVRAEQARTASETRFRALVEHSWDSILMLNTEGEIVYASPGIQRFGYRPEQVTGRKAADLMHPSDRGRVTQLASTLLEQPGKSLMVEIQIQRADGSWGWVEAIASNLLGESGTDAIVVNCRDVTERRQGEEEIRQYANEQATFYEIALRLNSQSTLPGLLQAIVEQGVGLVHAQAGTILGYDPELNALRVEKGIGFGSEYVGWLVEPGQGAAGKVWESRTPLVVNDYPQWAGRTIPFAYDARIKAVIAVPLLGSRDALGVLVINSNTPERQFTERDVRLLEMLSAQASLTIENALLYQQEHEHRELAETMREVGAVLTSTLDPQLVLDNILAQVGRVVPHDAANIMHIEDGVARIVRWRGYERFGTGDLQGFSIELDEHSIWHEMDESGKPVVLADTLTAPNWDGAPHMSWVRSFLGTPIRVRNQTVGFLNVNSEIPDFFTATHAGRLQALANQAAVALANAELFGKAHVAAERLQALSHRLVQTQEMERARIARELHDEMGQALTAQMVDLHFCEQHVQEPDAVAARLAVLKRSTDNVLENLHRLTVDLRPIALDHLGLIPALQQYVQSFCQQHPEIQVQFQVVGMGEERQPTETETALYRITQESLTNVARHAHATRVEVMIARRGEKVILMCWDNGVGFDPRGVGPNERMGLTSMRERASMLGGFVWIDSELGAGTTVHVEVPYVYSNSDSR